MDCPDGELSILIVDDTQIAEINKEHLNREGPTNVIAFSMREGRFSDITPHILGDVVISAQTAEREGKSAGFSMEERLTQLLVHGILHIFGYDHDHDDEKAREMEKKSKDLLSIISQE